MATSKKPKLPLAITPQQVIDFADHMLGKYGLKAIDKRKAEEIKLISSFLEKMGLLGYAADGTPLSIDDFVKRYSIVIGNRVYFPWTIGNAEECRLSNQISTITHECQHTIQFHKDGWKYLFNYLTSTAKRAYYEADAYKCNMELHYWATGQILSPASLAGLLKNYGCKSMDIKICEQTLSFAANMLKRNQVTTPASLEAISWLNKNMPKYKGQGDTMPARFYEV